MDCIDNKKWTVYVHIIPKEISEYKWDKYYVGITSQKAEQRWGLSGNGYVKNTHFSRAIKKYGWENIEHKIIAEGITKSEACELEMSLIKQLQSNNPLYGYNKTLGGEGRVYEFEDLSDKTFGYLYVNNLSKETGNCGERKWDCTCLLCGTQTTKFENTLKDGSTVSCGCFGREYCKTCGITHGKSYEKIYVKFSTIKRKCFNKNHGNYESYGGKGVTICDEWMNDFMNFYNWSMANGYADDKVIYLKKDAKEFSPDNCSWVTKSEYAKLAHNRRIKQITYNNETHSIKEWAEIIGIPISRLRDALKKKTFEEAFLFYTNKK